MRLTGLHFLLTYQCNFECDHCFVWGGPRQEGVLTLSQIREILRQAQALGTVESIYFEGGEPFLYYPILVEAVKEAVRLGFSAGIVTNGYWAVEPADARAWLEPFAGLIDDLTVSSDLFHYDEKLSRQSHNARQAAEELGIPFGLISIDAPEICGSTSSGQLPGGESGVMYRGRAVEKLALRAPLARWDTFTECPHENLREPGRIHVDPYGYLHICQGIALGNLFQTPLAEVCASYQPDYHPICSALLDGGPAELVRRYDTPHTTSYADACHLCYTARLSLRERFSEYLAPDAVYGML